MPTRPIMRYHGGKWKLASWLIGLFPPHHTYTEVFGGGASVLLQKNRSYAEVYNDIAGSVVNVFRILRDPAQASELERRIRLTPFSRDEFELASGVNIECEEDHIERARLMLFRSFAGFGSGATNTRHRTGFRSSTSRSRTAPPYDWMRYPDHIRSFTERLQGVVIENRPAIEVLQRHDKANALHYVDPPYVHETRYLSAGGKVYEYEMSDDDHRQLAGVLRTLKGMVVLSGYDCDLYEELYGDWRKVQREALADGARKRIETVWLNPSAADAQRQMKLSLQ